MTIYRRHDFPSGTAEFYVTMPSARPRLTLSVVRRTITHMTHKAKDLSPEQKTAIESLLGRSIAEGEEISIYATAPSTPGWLQSSWETAKQQGLDQLSAEEIDTEIAAARKARLERRASEQ